MRKVMGTILILGAMVVLFLAMWWMYDFRAALEIHAILYGVAGFVLMIGFGIYLLGFME